jgi:anaerobic selenocysteine-containing dehydrogenase
LPLTWVNLYGQPGGYQEAPADVVPLDMAREPTTDDLYELMCRGSNVALEEVKRHPHGHVFAHLAEQRVAPAEAGNTARLDVANPAALAELAACAQAPPRRDGLVLVPRRDNRMINSTGRTVPGLMGGRPYNPAFLHPDDMVALGLTSGDAVEIRSDRAAVIGIAEADPDLRPGVLSMSHGFGECPGDEENPAEVGANTNRLLRADRDYDPVTGMPRMGCVPVAVRRVAPAGVV